jgi:periplasmic protein TonB
MSNVSIYEKNWTDLVFEGKNKAYGAYQLRQENPRTTLLAFFISLLFIFALIGSWMLLSSFGKSTEDGIADIPMHETIRPIELIELPEAEPLKPKATQAQPQAPTELNRFLPMVVAPTPLAANNIPTNDNLPTNQNNSPVATPGTGDERPNNGGNPVGIETPSAPTGPVTTNLLDKLPQYPGGINKFYEYVGNSIDKSEINDSASSVSVIMGFVIEKDGTMTDIKVLRSSDKALEKEAIRVLKSLKVKWSPGYLNGDKVRTLYTLPIKVAI